MNKGIYLYNKAKKLIPGGVQLLSKRPELFLPGQWPSYYRRCRGVEVWDLEGNKYIDMSICGVGACTLGYADPDVDNAVIKAARSGNMCTLNVPEEVELAHLLCEIHPWAEMVRYARTGGEAMAMAIRIVRAATGKEKILFCGYHGWHDWYLSANLAKSDALDGQLLEGLEPRGVPRALRGTAIPFCYNELRGFKSLIEKYNNQIAGVVMEPVRNYWPDKDFLKKIRKITKEKNIPLVFDEVTSCLRMSSGGIHLKLDIDPDICVFAKALGNGYPMAAIIGRRKIMQAVQKSFISSTYWTDKIGPVAALATIRKHIKYNVSKHIIEVGNLVQAGWRNLAEKYEIDIEISGIPPLSHWQIKLKDSQLIHTVIVKKMLKRGFLSSKSFYSTYCHTERHANSYLDALDGILKEIMPFVNEGKVNKLYSGPVAYEGFKRLT